MLQEEQQEREQRREQSSMANLQLTRRHASQQRLLTATTATSSLETIHLSLHKTDLVTGDEDCLSALFYEYYRGYTIYSTAQGVCCMHGRQEGCLRLWGKYVSFPDIEDAKKLIKHFRARGIRSWESMERSLPAGNEQVCILNAAAAKLIGCA